MRLDGFSSWHAREEAGELITQKFRCDGDRIFVNADASRGSMDVQVLGDDEKNVTIRTDTLTSGEGWITGLKSVQGKEIQLRFTMKNADLFSFRIADEKTMKLAVPRATTK